MRRRIRKNATDFYDRQRPSEYARRLITSHGIKKAEEITKKGTKKYGKNQSGWWTAAYDATQTIKHSMSNPRSRRSQYLHKKMQSARKFAKKSFRTIRIGKRGKLLRVGCPRGRFKKDRCAVGMQAQSFFKPKYVGIARASRYRTKRRSAAN